MRMTSVYLYFTLFEVDTRVFCCKLAAVAFFFRWSMLHTACFRIEPACFIAAKCMCIVSLTDIDKRRNFGLAP